MELYARFARELEDLREERRERRIVPRAQEGGRIFADGRWLYNLSSNDYLGLGHDRELYEEFLKQVPDGSRYFSSSGSLLLTGAFPGYARTLERIEQAYGREAVLFSSGFAANSSVLSAIGDEKTLILADKLSHASILQGLRLGRAKTLRFAHNSLEHLSLLLDRYAACYDNVLVVTEAVFSMDGDQAPVRELCALKDHYHNLYLYVDEAHSFGIFGQQGLGLCHREGVLDRIDFVLCTLGKACGSCGAFVLCNSLSQQYLINKAQALIFSTALPPVVFEHIGFMFDRLREAEGRRERLRKLYTAVAALLVEQGFVLQSSSQILPLLTLEDERTLQAAEFFKEKGFLALPIRHPTVPEGRARLRLSLSAALPDDFYENFAAALAAYCSRYPV